MIDKDDKNIHSYRTIFLGGGLGATERNDLMVETERRRKTTQRPISYPMRDQAEPSYQ
jgi:hypothetical protein